MRTSYVYNLNYDARPPHAQCAVCSTRAGIKISRSRVHVHTLALLDMFPLFVRVPFGIYLMMEARFLSATGRPVDAAQPVNSPGGDDNFLDELVALARNYASAEAPVADPNVAGSSGVVAPSSDVPIESAPVAAPGDAPPSGVNLSATDDDQVAADYYFALRRHRAFMQSAEAVAMLVTPIGHDTTEHESVDM